MPDPHKETINGHEFSMLHVAGATFLMGSPEGDADGDDDEKPQHAVTVSSFYIGQFLVTQALWRAVVLAPVAGVASNHPVHSLEPSPSRFQGDDRPVESISWDEVQLFLQKLNALTKGTRPKDHHYYLPTEAEWEYAARGGCYSLPTGEGWGGAGYQYAGSDRLKDVGWYDENSGSETKPVGLKYPNQLGLYDMSGNVWEWCEDDWHTNYQGAPADGAAWVDSADRGSIRVIRGGCWLLNALFCRAANRINDGPDLRNINLGFRLALALQSVGRPIPAFL